jgi:hypothetical protein
MCQPTNLADCVQNWGCSSGENQTSLHRFFLGSLARPFKEPYGLTLILPAILVELCLFRATPRIERPDRYVPKADVVDANSAVGHEETSQWRLCSSAQPSARRGQAAYPYRVRVTSLLANARLSQSIDDVVDLLAKLHIARICVNQLMDPLHGDVRPDRV